MRYIFVTHHTFTNNIYSYIPHQCQFIPGWPFLIIKCHFLANLIKLTAVLIYHSFTKISKQPSLLKQCLFVTTNSTQE